ncbi:MAG: hypothetical protein K2M17_00440, partial [Bacilli bacterium]|nr:hypothetical protein [Bacilli bacterium]
TIESRLSKNKILPLQNITKDDVIFVKKSSGNVLAYFTLKKVIFLDLQEFSLEKLREKYEDALCVDEEFWQKKAQANYATLLSC